MKKIKILHIIKSLGRGGAEMLLPETLKLHDTKKFEFHYIYFLPWKDQMLSAIEQAGGTVTCVQAKNNIQLLFKAPQIIQYCKKHNIDVIHAHLPWAGFVSRLVHVITGIPLIYTEHNLQERYHVITKYLNKFTYNFQNTAIGVSNSVTQSILKDIKPKIQVVTLLNGVNTDEFVRDAALGESIRKEYNIANNELVIGTVAVFRPQKQLRIWIDIVGKLIKKNHTLKAIIVGAGPLEFELKKHVEENSMQNNIYFAGLQENVKPYFSAFDIFLMTSAFEGLPIALLEAMSMSCAVVSTDAGGVKEVLKQEENGLIKPIEQVYELEKEIEKLIQNRVLLEKLKTNARKTVMEYFSVQNLKDKLEEIYDHQKSHRN